MIKIHVHHFFNAMLFILSYTSEGYALPSYSLPGLRQVPQCSCKHRSRIITVQEGDTFSINLKSQESAGCMWAMTSPFFYDYIKLIDRSEMVCRCGGLGKTTFTFQALRPGEETIKFE